MAKSFSELPSAAQAAIVVVLVGALAGAGFYYYVWDISPWSPTIKKLTADVDSLRKEVAQLDAVKRQYQEYAIQIDQLKKRLESLRTIVPEEQATDQYVRMVYKAGQDSNIHVRTFVAQPQVDHDFYVEMPYAVHLDGIYWDLWRFFNRLSQSQRIVSVTGLAMGPPEGGGMGAYTLVSGETVGANCVLTTYYTKPAAPAAAAAAAKK